MCDSRKNDGRLLSILVPVYNERAYLRRCVEKILAAPLPEGLAREVILVDDASTDGTRALVREIAEAHAPVIRAFYQEQNQGKGAAVRRAIKEMRGQYAIFQDADLEYDPDEYSVLLKPLLDGSADVVYGSRFAASPLRRVLNFYHSLGNQMLTLLSNFFTDLYLTDMETCYKAFRADLLRTIPLRSNRFGIEPEITAKIAKRGCAVYEVPISYHGRSYLEGKKIGWKDAVQAVYVILKYWMIDDCYDEGRYGAAVLKILQTARRFSDWTAKLIEPFLGERILETGSGIGNMSRLLPKRQKLIVSDIDPAYLELLNDIYGDNDLVDVVRLDLACDEDFAALGGDAADTVVCLNVLEHIEDDGAVLARLRQILSPGGRLILVVPQYPALFGSYDRKLGHCRRYDREALSAALRERGYRVSHMRGFNFLAIAGWWFNSCVLKREAMSKLQLKIFDSLVPLTRLVETVLPLPGLSLLCVAELETPSSE